MPRALAARLEALGQAPQRAPRRGVGGERQPASRARGQPAAAGRRRARQAEALASAIAERRAQAARMREEREHEPRGSALAQRPAPALRSTCARVSSISLSYCTPDGQAVTQAMQPRQLSMCSTSGADSSLRGPASSARSARAASPSPRPRASRWGRWAGRSRSARSRRSGRAAAARMSSKPLTASTPGAQAPGGVEALLHAAHQLEQRRRRARPTGPPLAHVRRRVEHDARRRRHAAQRPRASGAASGRVIRSQDRPERRAAHRAAPSGARDRQHVRQVGLAARTRAPSCPLAARALAVALRGPERRRRPRPAPVEPGSPMSGAAPPPAGRGARRRSGPARPVAVLPAHVEADCSSSGAWRERCRRRGRASAGSRSARTAVAVAAGSGCRRTDTSRIAPERAERAGEQLGQVVAGHVLDHLAAGLRARAVGERHRACRPPGRARRRSGERSGPESPLATTPPTVAPPSGGSSASIWPACGERAPGRAASGTPASSDRGQVAGVVLDDPVEPGGGELDVGLERRDGRPAELGARAAHAHGWPAAAAARSSAASSSREPGVAGVRPGWPSEALRQPGLLQRVAAVGAGHLAAQPRRGHHLAGVGQPVGVERAAQPLERRRGRRRRTSAACSASCPRPRRARR